MSRNEHGLNPASVRASGGVDVSTPETLVLHLPAGRAERTHGLEAIFEPRSTDIETFLTRFNRQTTPWIGQAIRVTVTLQPGGAFEIGELEVVLANGQRSAIVAE